MGARAKDDADMDNVPESRTGKPQARSLLEASDSPAPGHPLALEGLAVVAGGSKGRPNPLQHSLISSASGPYRAWQPNAESPARSPGRGSGGRGLPRRSSSGRALWWASAYSPFFWRLRDQIRV